MAGCGGGDDAEREQMGDRAAVLAVGQKYVDAVAARDWEAVCETRTKEDAAELARIAGSCERAFEAIIPRQAAGLFESIEVRVGKLGSDRAELHMYQPDQERPVDEDPLIALKEGEDWRLVSEEILEGNRSRGRD